MQYYSQATLAIDNALGSMAAVVPSLEALLALPKVELRLHLDGSCRHATLRELARCAL